VVSGPGGEAVAVGVGDRLGSVARTGLAVQVVDVTLDGGFGDGEPLGDLGVGESFGDEVRTAASRGVSPSGS
jgi:hypothetical protein